MTMDEKEKKLEHLRARCGRVNELRCWVINSGDGGEYFISVNGNRMWLSQGEMSLLLNELDNLFGYLARSYTKAPASGMVID